MGSRRRDYGPTANVTSKSGRAIRAYRWPFAIIDGALASGLMVRHLILDQGIEGSNPSSPANPLAVRTLRRVPAQLQILLFGASSRILRHVAIRQSLPLEQVQDVSSDEHSISL